MSKEHRLSTIRLFAGLTTEHLDALLEVGVFRTYEQGATVFSEGDDGTHLYALLAGRVQLSVQLGDATEQVPVHTCTSGSEFGEFVLFETTPRTATARAVKSTEVFVVTREELDRVFARFPDAGLTVLRNLCGILVGRMRKTTTELRASLTW